MGCACNGNGAAKNGNEEAEYVVTLPGGKTETVRGEHAAKVKVTMAGGGTYTKR
jgi:hypothetical protein